MRTKIFILKWIDRLIGRPTVILLSKLSLPYSNFLPLADGDRKRGDLSFLIIRPGGIGDATLLFPALNGLRKSFPLSQIHVLAEKRNAGILELCPSVNRLYLYDRGLDIFRVLRNRYDVVIDTEQWHRLSAIIAYLTRAKVRIGFSTNERGRLFTHKVEYSHHDYEVNSFLKLFGAVINKNIEFDPEEPFINIPASNHELTVALSLEASIKEREWGIEKFMELANRLIKRNIRVILIGKKRLSLPILQRSEGITDLSGKMSLAETAARIARVNLLITGDTGIMHIAYGLGIPTISLFGPGIEDKWAPKGKNHIIINKRLPCSPCTKFGYTPKCQRDAECMKLITVDEVEDAVLKLISQNKK